MDQGRCYWSGSENRSNSCTKYLCVLHYVVFMMTSSNGKKFRVTGPLCGEFPGDRWIPLKKASDADLKCFLWSAIWINGWVSNRAAGDLRRHRAHYDGIVMYNITYNMFHQICTWIALSLCHPKIYDLTPPVDPPHAVRHPSWLSQSQLTSFIIYPMEYLHCSVVACFHCINVFRNIRVLEAAGFTDGGTTIVWLFQRQWNAFRIQIQNRLLQLLRIRST